VLEEINLMRREREKKERKEYEDGWERRIDHTCIWSPYDT
jgi:hypothetical protein